MPKFARATLQTVMIWSFRLSSSYISRSCCVKSSRARSSSRCSWQYFSHAGLLLVAGVVSLPLSLLILLDLGIYNGLFLLDGLAEEPAVHVLPLQFHLMVIENTVQFPGSLFGELTAFRSEEHTSELQSRRDLVCRLLLEKKKKKVIR